MIKQTYFTQLNKIYSNTLTTIEFTILETLPKINFDKKKQIQTNKKIIEELERIIKNKNKVQIRGIINDKPKSTKKNQVLKIIKTLEKKTDNKNSSKPKDDNYDFIAATNSHEIINQIQLQTRNNTQFKTLKNQINRYLESNSPLNNKQVRLMNNTISKYKDKIQDSELRLKQFQIEKLSPIKKY